MPFFVRQSKSGVRKTGQHDYQDLTDDPRFVFRFWTRRPRYMVAFLQALDGSLDPKIYADRGRGFNESSSISLSHAGTCMYSISVSTPHRVAKIRIDPCSAEERFRFWVKFAWNETDFAKLLDQAKQEAEGTVSLYNIVIDGTREKRSKEKTPRRIAENFASVIQLAKRTAPPIGDDIIQDGPFISFVVPVHNASEIYLKDPLASFRDRPVGAAELVLCDDGSTSGQTKSWLAHHENARDVRVIRNASNLGIAATTNSCQSAL